jgi:hypothetical protein
LLRSHLGLERGRTVRRTRPAWRGAALATGPRPAGRIVLTGTLFLDDAEDVVEGLVFDTGLEIQAATTEIDLKGHASMCNLL